MSIVRYRFQKVGTANVETRCDNPGYRAIRSADSVRLGWPSFGKNHVSIRSLSTNNSRCCNGCSVEREYHAVITIEVCVAQDDIYGIAGKKKSVIGGPEAVAETRKAAAGDKSSVRFGSAGDADPG